MREEALRKCNAFTAVFWGLTRNRITLAKSQKKVVVPQCFFGSKTLQCRPIEPRFGGGWYSTITLSVSTIPVCLTAFWIDDIITAQQNSFDADTLDGCLHFVCKFDHRAEGTLTPGDLDNHNLKRRPAIDQHPSAQPHTCTLKI